MWVVKLGGSLLGSPTLPGWLDALAKVSDGNVLIVPGGGVFADAVRVAQQRSGVDAAAAHRMAVLAMDQYGMLLAAMNKQLVTASSELEIAERSWQHRCIVWLPSQMVLAEDSIPMGWHVTSDSLAAWIARKIGAEQLILVKSAPITSLASSVAVQEIMQSELVDEAFAGFSTNVDFDTWLLHQSDFAVFEQGLDLNLLGQTAKRLIV